MPKFIYRAKKDPANFTEGTITADSRSSAIEKLSSQGYYLLSIEEYLKSLDSRHQKIFKKAGLKEVSIFSRQLSDLLEAGVTIVKALGILERQVENHYLKEVISDIRNHCLDGNPLSGGLSRHPEIFPNLFVSMVRSGEAAGAMENILRRLADFNQKQLEIQTKIRASLAYPALMAGVGVITIAVLLTFVIPKMAAMFSDLGQNLPLPTLILIGISNFTKAWWWLILALAILAGFLAREFYRSPAGKLSLDRSKLSLKLVGGLIRKFELARFSRTLATLLENGVPMLEALNITADTVDNSVIREEIRRASLQVKEGKSLAAAFLQKQLMPEFLVSMVAVGEESGQVENSLFKVAESYERDTDSAVKAMMSLLEPVLILVLGLIVGFIVISMLLPIFEINFLAR